MTRPRAAFFAPTLLALVSVSVLGFGACSNDPRLGLDSGGPDSDSDSDSTSDASDSLGDVGAGAAAGDSDTGNGGAGPVCEKASSEAVLQPIFLAFAFDVSGSMGQLDCPNWWHDKSKKWDPVVAATKEFFTDTDSEGISASMVLFPEGGDDECLSATYATPGVAMTGLPSTSFGTLLDGYIANDAWRGGTPTRRAVEGTAAYLNTLRPAHPGAKFAVVLVTDGLPQGCSDSVGNVTTAVGNILDDGVPTYVIGVQNPTTSPEVSDPLPTEFGDTDPWSGWQCGAQLGTPQTPPNTLTDLNQVAAAGGTENAVLIDTNNPSATKAAFRTAIDAIRAKALSCELGIPEHPTAGKTFDKDRINVSVTVAGATTAYSYDPACGEAGSWHYDDADAPKFIVLCESTCQEVQSTPGAELNVDFLCEDNPEIVR